MTARVQYLQQVMSRYTDSSSNSNFPNSLLLTSKASYYDWNKILTKRCNDISPDLIFYLENGEVSSIEGEDDATRREVIKLVDSIIRLILKDTASGYVLQEVNSFDGTGRELYLFLRSTYGDITVPAAIGIMCDKFNTTSRLKEGLTLALFKNSYDRLDTLIEKRFSPEIYNTIVYLAYLKKEGFPVDDFVSSYRHLYGTGWEDFTLINLQHIVRDRMENNTDFVSGSLKALVCEKVTKCLNCQKPGHLAINCLAPQPLSNLKYQLETNKNSGMFSMQPVYSGTQRFSDAVHLDRGASEHTYRGILYFKDSAPVPEPFTDTPAVEFETEGVNNRPVLHHTNSSLEKKFRIKENVDALEKQLFGSDFMHDYLQEAASQFRSAFKREEAGDMVEMFYTRFDNMYQIGEFCHEHPDPGKIGLSFMMGDLGRLIHNWKFDKFAQFRAKKKRIRDSYEKVATLSTGIDQLLKQREEEMDAILEEFSRKKEKIENTYQEKMRMIEPMLPLCNLGKRFVVQNQEIKNIYMDKYQKVSPPPDEDFNTWASARWEIDKYTFVTDGFQKSLNDAQFRQMILKFFKGPQESSSDKRGA